MESLRVTVLGAGNWGTALTHLLARNGHQVKLWAREEEIVRGVNETRRNPLFLTGAELPEGVEATGELGEAVQDAEMVLVVIPSQFVREHMIAIRDEMPPRIPIVICSKGIERESLCTMHQVLKEELPGKHHSGICVLSGPSFALEVAECHPTNVTVASENVEAAEFVQHSVATRDFRIYTSPDILGVELGGALKNVIAIAAGAADGLGFGHNSKAGLMTRGLAEITRLAVGMGGRPETMAGLAGMGDLILTCTGHLSRNRQVGEKMAKGMTLEQLRSEMRQVAEGVATSVSVHELTAREGVETPISEQVYQVLHQGKSVPEAMESLLARSLKPEWEL
ncbi:NAD(P)H-dependent glycerol-3-phosphate dehydrogenase [Myxococcota bacterium]